MSLQLCKHFTKDWLAESESYYLTGVQKGIVGELNALSLLQGLKQATGLLNRQPEHLGSPYELQVSGDVPDIMAIGNEHTYLFEVKNWFPVIGKTSFAPPPYHIGTVRDYHNIYSEIIDKRWSEPKYYLREHSGEHRRRVVSVLNSDIDTIIKCPIISYPMLTENARRALHQYFGANIAFNCHAFLLDKEMVEPCCAKRAYLLGKQLELIIKRNEDEKA